MPGSASLASYLNPPPGANINSLQGPRSDSLWDPSSPAYGYGNEGINFDCPYRDVGSLRLPPINPASDAEYHYRPPPTLNHPQFFEIGQQRHQSLSPGLGFADLGSPASASRSQEPDQDQEPPPSNQQAHRSQQQQQPPSSSQYSVAGPASPDPFQDPFLDIADFDFSGLSPPRSSSPAAPRSYNTTRRSSFVDLTEPSPPDNAMAPARKRKAEDEASPGGTAPKAARWTARRRKTPPKREQSLNDVEVVDLADVDTEQQFSELAAKQQAEKLKKQQKDDATRPFRLAEFNCIICMDNPTGLTVTHCGHLFCSECLHQALYAGDKKACPVCRTAISTTMTGREGQKRQPKNGIFVLEMKLMTATRMGKRPAGPS